MQKIATYIGFAVKSGNISFGAESIISYPKRPKVVLFDSTLSLNAVEKLTQHCQKKHIMCIKTDVPIASLTGKTNCKAIAIYDKNLGEEIIKVIGNKS